MLPNDDTGDNGGLVDGGAIILKGCPKKNVTRSKFKSVISQEPDVQGDCPSHSL